MAFVVDASTTACWLMPDEFEKLIDKRQMADLIEYLLTVVK